MNPDRYMKNAYLFLSRPLFLIGCGQIENETRAIVGGQVVSSRSSARAGLVSGGPTVAVVNLVIALRGDELKRLGLDRSVNSMSGEILLRCRSACPVFFIVILACLS